MNKNLDEIIRTSETKMYMSEEMKESYVFGLRKLGIFVSQDFFDVPKLPYSMFYGEDGLYYNIPYYDDEISAVSGNTYDLVTVYKIEDHGRLCPALIRIKLEDPTDEDSDFEIIIRVHGTNKSTNHTFIKREGGAYYSDLGDDYRKVTLSNLVEFFEENRESQDDQKSSGDSVYVSKNRVVRC